MTRSEVEQLIEAAIAPLRQEIQMLKAKLEPETLPPSSENTTLEPAPAPMTLEPETGNEIPSERTDFQRFLQRGLEQEQVRYSEEALEDKPTVKKGGWNPFRR